MTNEEQNRSQDSDEVSRNKNSTTGKTVVDRRTCMKLAGVTAASLAGCTGKDVPTTGEAEARFGYGGEPAVTTQLAAVDVSKVAKDNSMASSVSRLSINSPLSTTLSPSSSDLFAFRPDTKDVTVKFSPSADTGAAALGLFNPDGELLSQAYASSNAPVYLPDSLSASGTHYLQVMDISRSGGEYSLNISTDSTTQSQSPYEGTVRAIPGRIQAQNFDIGGEGEAYHDTSGGNIYGSANRDTDVDIRPTEDESGKYNIGYLQAGEWLEYTIEVSAGTYDVSLRVASALSDGRLELSLGDRTLTTVTVPNTGDWTSWETVTVEDIEIESDQQSTLRVEALDSGVEFNWIEFDRVDTQKPYSGTLATIPGRIEAQNYDTGGEGVSYSDTTAGNEYDTSYRDTDVDIRETLDNTGKYNIGYFKNGEWLEYTAEVPAGTYDINARIATRRDSRQLQFSLDGEQLGTVGVPNTGGWTTWETATLHNVTVQDGGDHIIQVKAVGSGINFNWFEFREADKTETPSETETPTETETATGLGTDDFGSEGYGMGGYGGTQ